MFSAVKKDGVRLYDLARRGIEVEREARKVTVSKLKLLTYDEESFSGQLLVSCSKGTYIRTLIDDIGRELGCGAVMTSLVRTRACGFSLEDSVTLDEIRKITEEGSDPQKAEGFLRTCDSLFEVYRRIDVSEKQAFRFLNGNPLDIARTALKRGCEDGEIVRVYGGGVFLGLGKAESESGLVRMFKLFSQRC